MDDLPTGTVTFLLTDIQGSTVLWERSPEQMHAAIDRHHEIVRSTVTKNGGHLPKDQGEGDAVFAVFARAMDAVTAAVGMQRALHSEPWPEQTPIVVRVGLHTGEAEVRNENYFGVAVSRCARVRSTGHGGQIVCSQTTWDLIADAPPDRVSARDLGVHTLKDLSRKERIWQIVHPDLPSDFPALKTVESRPNNLPAQATSFVGRDAEIDDVRELLAGDARLVTILGPGGIGKTRLAIEAAAGLAEYFDDGIWFVSLEGVADLELVSSAIAHAVGAGEERAASASEALAEHLASSTALLVLDNFEHVAEGARAVADLLTSCAGIRVLGTSREPLRVNGEHEFALDVLGVPAPGETDPDRIAASGAVALFAVRAAAVRRGFEVTADLAPAVAEICRRLDGLPLAVELAAARVKLLPPQKLLERLDSTLATLTGGGRDKPDRHRTLRATIEWSYDLLEPGEQTLLARLAAFAGPFSIDSAEAVGGGDSDVDVFDGIESLSSKSLLRMREQDDEPVFDMLSTVREFARERLTESGEADVVADAHMDWFLGRLDEAASEITGRGAEWIRRLDRDRADLSAAVGRALDVGQAEPVLRQCAGPLFYLWTMRGLLTEGRRCLQDALAAGGEVDDEVRADALRAAGDLARRQRDFAVAEAHLTESLRLETRLGRVAAQGRTLNALGVLYQDHGDLDRTRDTLTEALQRFEAAGDATGRCDAGSNLGVVCYLLGELEAAREHLEAALVLAGELGRRSVAADVASNLALVAEAQGRIDEAIDLHTSALQERRQLEDLVGVVVCLRSLAFVLRMRDAPDAAAGHLTEAVSLMRRADDAVALAEVLVDLAEVDVALAQHEAAREAATEALELATSAGYAPAIVVAQCVLARPEVAADPESSLAWARAALDVATGAGADLEASAMTSLSRALASAGQAADAVAAASQAVERAREAGGSLELIEALEALSACAASGDAAAAGRAGAEARDLRAVWARR